MSINIDIAQLSRNEKLQLYLDNRAPIFNKKALFSDGTSDFRSPCEPMAYEKVTLRFRTAKGNVNTVYLVSSGARQVMKKAYSDSLFDYFESDLNLEDKRVDYYFEVHSGKLVCFYNNKGFLKELQPYYNFFINPGFRTPDWAKGAVFYQIFVDRFCNGDKTNDIEDREYSYIGDVVKKVADWDKYPAAVGVREFYGGDLKGVMKKLDYLEDLGVEVIYLNPIFVSPSNHKYDIQDYDYVDPHFGVIAEDKGENLQEGDIVNAHASRYICRVTNRKNLEASNRLFIKLVKEIHKRGMKIILDGVFNHCGSFNKWLDRERIYENQEGYTKGAFIDKNSPYNSFFRFREEAWPYNEKYDGWWGYETLPKLNYEESPKLYGYIMEIARKWVSAPYNVDGWRLDVAADLGHSNEYNHIFWKDFRKNVKEANPEAIILAEHYGDPADWLQGDEWDTVMNYDAFMEPLSWFLTGVEKHSDEYRENLLGSSQVFFDTMSHHMTRYNFQSLMTSMNELSNHDHSRFLTRTNGRVGRTATAGPEAAEANVNYGIMRQAVLIQMTWIGAPTIYYGDEAGVCGWTDPDNRRTYPWGNENMEFIHLHKDLIRIHKQYEALKTGSIIFLGGGYRFISYGRFNQKEKLIIAVNSSYQEIMVDIPVWRTGITENDRLVRLIMTTKDGHDIEKEVYETNDGILALTLSPISAVILKNLENY